MIMDSNTLISDVLHDDVRVAAPAGLDIKGIVDGNICVEPNSFLIVHGIVNGNIDAETNSTVEVHGIVCGTITNLGGSVHIWGIVEEVQGDNRSVLAEKGSIIGKVQLSATQLLPI